MRKVAIRTAQNVAIDFALASIGQRVLGFFIDMILLGAVMFFMLILLTSVHPNLIYLVPGFFFFYTPLFEIYMGGQTPGKRVAKTRVVNIYGKAPNTFDIWIRWVFRMVDIWFSLGSIAVVFISTTNRSQRLGGILSNTMVVSLKGEIDLSLSDILRIDDRSKYEPVYPEVYRFSEEEMLTVKQLLDRYQRYGNDAHQALLRRAAEKCSAVLELKTVPEKQVAFLKTVIKDYIVVTRS